MTGAEVTDALVSLGGLTGLGSLVASLATLRKATKVKEDTQQLRPDHGSSVADKQDQVLELVRSQGHQLGEHQALIVRILDQVTAVGERVTLIENRPMGYPWDREDTRR